MEATEKPLDHLARGPAWSNRLIGSGRTVVLTACRCVEIIVWLTWHTLRFGARSLGRWVLGVGKGTNALLGEFITELFESLGTTFIKAGQVMSSRPDLLSEEVVASLRRLQDQVAPFDVGEIPGLIERAFQRPLTEVFETFDFEPISSASVAHVHRAQLRGGREVAVKIRRPGVVLKVRNDLRLFKAFATALDYLPAMRWVPLRELVAEVGGAVEQQLDLALEAENNRQFCHNFVITDYIKIPKLVSELCTESVLTMEYIPNLLKVDESHHLSRKDRENAAVVGLRALYKMIFIDGFIHADMHPGNIFLREYGEFVLLDLGLVAKLEGQDLDSFVDFFYGMVTNDGMRCAEIICDTASSFAPGFEREKFDAAMVQLIDRHASLSAEDFEVTRFAFQLFDTQRTFGVRGATTFTMTILSLVVYEGIVKQLYPSLNFQREARGFLITAKYGRHDRRRLEVAGPP